MRAAGEVALIQKRAKLAEAPVQLIERELPQPQLANAGRVGHISAAQVIERDQLGHRGRVAALAERLADIAGSQAQVRLHDIQQTALADTRFSGYDADAPAQPRPQLINAQVLLSAGVDHRVADLLVDRKLL